MSQFSNDGVVENGRCGVRSVGMGGPMKVNTLTGFAWRARGEIDTRWNIRDDSELSCGNRAFETKDIRGFIVFLVESRVTPCWKLVEIDSRQPELAD